MFVECEMNFFFPRRFLWSFDRWYNSNICFNKALENFLKLENSPLKISTSLSSLSRTSYCDVKSISFPKKASIAKEQSTHLNGPGFWRFWNLVYQIPGGRPRGAEMPRSRDREPEQMPRGCPGGWAQVELTDALIKHYIFHTWFLELSRFFRTNLCFPWRFEESGFHCNNNYCNRKQTSKNTRWGFLLS